VPKVRKAFELSTSDWLLIVSATMWFAVVELGLRIVRLRTLLAILQHRRRSDRESDNQSFATAERSRYCVELASRLCPLPPTCLKKALVLFALLTRRGFDLQLLIGVAKTEGELEAHAWLEHQGRVIMGGPGCERYSILCCLDHSMAGAHPKEQATS
jgi:transglutaminase superfamily protein